jgi:two-component system CheB/CheR fusion protein
MAKQSPGQNPPSSAATHVVAIGASAGGLDAFKRLLAKVPEQSGMAFIILQHLDPTQPSHMHEILARWTKIPVTLATDGCPLLGRHIYVTPPHTDICVVNGILQLRPHISTMGESYHPIDKLFANLASEHRDRTIGVVLSGSGTDGAMGVKSIRAVGGLTIAQDQESAVYKDMPRAAMEAGADLILPPENIGEALGQETANLFAAWKVAPALESMPAASDDTLAPVLEWLVSARAADFSNYKCSTIGRRIKRRMAYLQIENSSDYVRYLTDHPIEVDKLYEDLLIKVTSFFREPEAFALLQQEIFPKILRYKDPGAPIRIWVPGCATGEEAYSFAICLAELIGKEGGSAISHPVQIFATDISGEAITRARSGLFDREAVSGLTSEQLARFFTVTSNGNYLINRAIRDQCVFARQDVTRDPPFSSLDLVSCRNLLIYFTPTLQRRVLATFHFALSPGGYLVLGEAETVGQSGDLFAPTAPGSKIFLRRAVRAVIPDFTQEYMAGRTAADIRSRVPHPTSSADTIKNDVARALSAYWKLSGVVVDENMEILQFLGTTSAYLNHPSGEIPSFGLIKMAPESIRVDLRLVLHEAATTERALQRRELTLTSRDRESSKINIEVIPFKNSVTGQRLFLVLFGADGETKGNLAVGTTPLGSTLTGDSTAQTVALLTRELEETKAYLNSLIEGEQAANEELKSTSEELLSSNEELQSTNQELQTAREETQAINEELRTVNEELDRRLYDLSQLNSDLINTMSSAQVALIMLSDHLLCRRITPAAERILGVDGTAVGQPLSAVLSGFGEGNLTQIAREVIDTLTSREIEIQDARGRWYELRVRPFVSIDKKVDGAVIALRDIDVQKQLMRRLEVASEQALTAKSEAENANRAKSEFLANISHEIRTPLTTILALSETLTEVSDLSPDHMTKLAKMQACIRQVTHLVDEILDLAKIEAGKLSIQLVSVSLISELAEILQPLRAQAQAKGLNFKLNFHGSFPQTILTDAARWRQILNNIIGNAVKFTDRGEIHVNFSLTREHLLSCAVSDTGCGLTAAEQRRIFQPFGQGDSSFTRRFGGSGLGLCLARQLAEALGGDVVLTASEPGVGSTFTATINPGPLTGTNLIESLTDADLTSFYTNISLKNDINLPRLTNMHILLADDSSENRLLMTHFLERQGATVTQAEDGAEARKLGLSGTYDLVLLDIQMPYLDGYGVCQQLRAAGVSFPVVALTAHAMQGVRESCLKAGFTDVLTKPISFRQLVEAVSCFRPKA